MIKSWRFVRYVFDTCSMCVRIEERFYYFGISIEGLSFCHFLVLWYSFRYYANTKKLNKNERKYKRLCGKHLSTY